MTEHIEKLCLVDMPFGEKCDLKTGTLIDFNQIYQQDIKPAAEKAGLNCIRGDHETTGASFIQPCLPGYCSANLLLPT